MTDFSEADDLISSALYLASQGLRVFPLKPGTKIPAITAWQENATIDPERIAQWFMLKYPGHNFGVVANDLIVLDVDTHHEAKHGPSTLAALEAEYGKLPPTWVVRTASGGLHYYFTNPGDVKITKGADKAGPGLDVQTGNAYLVGPYSVIGDKFYEPLDRSPLAAAPVWLLDLIKDKPPAPVKIYRATTPERPVSNKYVQAAIQGELDRLDECARSGWNGPPWDETTYEVACNLLEISNTPEADYSHNQAYSDFMAHAPADEKFGSRQHVAKWTSAQRKVGGSQRQFPASHVPPVQAADWRKFDAEVTPAEIVLPPAPPVIRREDYHAEDFFGKNGLLVEKLAQAVKYDFGLGPDMELWHYEGGIYKPAPMELMKRVTRILGDRYRPGHYNAVKDFVSALEDMVQLTTEQPDSRYIILANGVYAWQDHKLLPHSPDYGAITRLPIEFDAAAECPEFDRYLSEVIPADTIPLVWEMIGYLLMFGNPLQRSIIFQGPGGNGKSTLLRVLLHMLGKENVSALSLRQISEDRFALAGLLGKTANLAGDIDSKYLGDASRFKQVVGGDILEVERKYGQPFNFSPYVVPVFSANEFWKTGDTTEGYWRRWLPIPFPFRVGGAGSRHLDEQLLLDEIPGIFNHAVSSLRELMQKRDAWELPNLPPSVVALRKEMQDSADILADWFSEDDSIEANDPASEKIRATRTEVYAAFKRWCAMSGHKGMSSTSFYKRLLQLGYGEAKVRGQRYIYGIQIAPFQQPTLNL